MDKKARILVAGAGTGKEMIDWAQNNPNWSFIGFDPAGAMLSIASGHRGETLKSLCDQEKICQPFTNNRWV